MKASDRIQTGEAMWSSHGNRVLLVVARRQAEGGVYCLLSDKQAERSHLCLVCHKQRIGLDMKDLEGEI